MQPPDLPSEMGRRIVDQLDDKGGDDDSTLDWKTGSGLEQTMELQIKGEDEMIKKSDREMVGGGGKERQMKGIIRLII